MTESGTIQRAIKAKESGTVGQSQKEDSTPKRLTFVMARKNFVTTYITWEFSISHNTDTRVFSTENQLKKICIRPSFHSVRSVRTKKYTKKIFQLWNNLKTLSHLCI